MNKRKEEREGENEPVNIFFGAVHTYAEDESMKYVILDVGEGSWFTACQILGRRLGFPGTGSASDIGEIVGNMSFEQIRKGLERTMGDTTNIEATLREYSQKQTRTITK